MEILTATEIQYRNTIDQLRTNAKSHKKTVDKLSAKVSKLTQERNAAEELASVNKREADFYKSQFEAHCNVKKFKVGGYDAYQILGDNSDCRLVFKMMLGAIVGAAIGIIAGYYL